MKLMKVKRNIGRKSLSEFGKIGTRVLVDTDKEFILGNSDDKHKWFYNESPAGNKTLLGRIHMSLGKTNYATEFEPCCDLLFKVNDTHYGLEEENVSLFDFIKTSIKLKPNPTIIYNSVTLEKDNLLNSLLMIKEDDVIEIIYESEIEKVDIKCLTNL